jgi:small subunit ribosomal protein S11
MTEEKDITTEDKKAEKPAVKKPVELKVEKDSEDTKEESGFFAAKKEKENINDILKVQKDASGLEELPEEIRKKIEKKQAENKQKTKKSKIISKRKKEKTKVTIGNAYVKSSYNNTIVTLTDTKGNVLAWASAGVAGFKGPKKATPYAAQIVTRLAVGKAREEYGLSEVSVFVTGIGTGRESAIRSLNNNGLIVTSIKDVTPIPHNGCRIRKPRRM